MAVFAISDLHLSYAQPKPMTIFGDIWQDHGEKIRRNWDELVSEDDIVLVPGDTSWAMRVQDAVPDLNFLAERPGHIVLIRGNHDYWWQRKATTSIRKRLDRNLLFLQGTSVVLNDIGITGTRGWRVDWEQDASEGIPNHPHTPLPEDARGDKVLDRELSYLENGLQSIPDSVNLKIAMLHYPPFDEHLQPNAFAHLLRQYSVDILVYGHVHLGLGNWLEGDVEGVCYHIVSADVLNFAPKLIVP